MSVSTAKFLALLAQKANKKDVQEQIQKLDGVSVDTLKDIDTADFQKVVVDEYLDETI